jgi:hypothetical protein
VRAGKLKRSALILLAALPAMVWTSLASTDTQADAAFHKLQSLAGSWEGKDQQGQAVKTTFAPIAGGTAVMETLTMPGMDQMVTLYSIDVDSIVLVHYCPTNNQPRMRAVPPDGALEELVFFFQGAGNLPDISAGHEQKLVLEFHDPDHITEHWTWRRAGKDTEMVFRFARSRVANKRS